MLTFRDLLKMQEELNSHLDAPPPTDKQLYSAILAELGELMQSRKGEWCWWTRNGEAFQSKPRAVQVEEGDDILHFAVTGALGRKDLSYALANMTGPDGLDIWEREWASTVPVAFSEILNRYALPPGPLWVVASVMLFKLCGFTREEIEAGFIATIEKNKARWAKPELPKASAANGWLSWASSLLRF